MPFPSWATRHSYCCWWLHKRVWHEGPNLSHAVQAMLGFAADLIGEQLTGGKGPLQQIGLGIGQPLNPDLAGFGLAVWIGFFALAAVGFGKLGQQTGGNDIY